MVLWYMHNCNFVWSYEKRTAFPLPVFLKTYKHGTALFADPLYMVSPISAYKYGKYGSKFIDCPQ